MLGVLASLLAIPPVRYTLNAQLQFALSEQNMPFLHALEVRHSWREARRLDLVAASDPDDYLLHVGRATALATEVGRNRHPDPHVPTATLDDDHTLFRLGEVVRHFPQSPGAYAHLTRYMMIDRIRIQRVELGDYSTRPPASATSTPQHRSLFQRLRSHLFKLPVKTSGGTSIPEVPLTQSVSPQAEDFRLMEWALRSGESRDRDNAFWPTMLATTYFAAQRDKEALEALARASRKTRWDAYIYEEVLGQWRLYSAAYGDNGAVQQIGPLSLVAFPHLREIRKMAELVRLHADVAAAHKRENEAVRIRRNLEALGIIMREKAQWAYEALIGTDLCILAATDSRSRVLPSSIRTLRQWEPEASEYLALLERTHRKFDIAWIRREVDNSCALRQRIDLARYDASYPGIPPGIPLTPLFGCWMAGICVLQEMFLFAAVYLISASWQWMRRRTGSAAPSRRLRTLGWALLISATILNGLLIFNSLPSPGGVLLFLALTSLVLVLILEGIVRYRNRKKRAANGAPFADNDIRIASGISEAEARWTNGTTLRMLLLLMIPTLTALYFLRPFLSTLHPVAIILASLIDISRTDNPTAVLDMALLAGILPLAVILISCLWGLVRRVSPLESARIGISRLTVPAISCLVLAYLLLLNRTMLLDVAASRAISEAAQNDLQWVLTHSADPSEIPETIPTPSS